MTYGLVEDYWKPVIYEFFGKVILAHLLQMFMLLMAIRKDCCSAEKLV